MDVSKLVWQSTSERAYRIWRRSVCCEIHCPFLFFFPSLSLSLSLPFFRYHHSLPLLRSNCIQYCPILFLLFVSNFCFIPYNFVLFLTILFYFLQFCFISYNIVLFLTILFYFLQFWFISYNFVLFLTILFWFIS